ncbi:WD40 repeat-like protein, partial [Metschnikowia bicuspidata var. bicuspidata NRRL YB-4993]
RKTPSSVPVTRTALALLRPAKRLSCHDHASVTSLDFDDSGQFLLSAAADRTIQLYDCHKGVRQREVQSQKYGAHLARFTHDGLSCLYASTPAVGGAGPDHAVRLLLLALKSYLRYFRGHTDQVVLLEMNPVSRTFLSAAADHTVKTWDLRALQPLGSVGTARAAQVAFDPHGVVFAVAEAPQPAAEPGCVALYSTAACDRGPFLRVLLAAASPDAWTRAEFSNTGRWLLVATALARHLVLDALLGRLRATLEVDAHAAPGWMRFQYASAGAACFSADGRHVFAGHVDGSVALFDLAALAPDAADDAPPVTVRPCAMLPSRQGIPKVVAFNPRLLALATADSSVVLWSPPADD